LANKFILDRQLQKARRAKAELESSAPERLGSARTSMQNTRALMMAWQMYAIAPPPRAAGGKPARQDWSPADMQAMADEEQPLASLINSNYLDDYPPNFDGLAEIMEVPAETVTRCAKVLDRLAGKPGGSQNRFTPLVRRKCKIWSSNQRYRCWQNFYLLPRAAWFGERSTTAGPQRCRQSALPAAAPTPPNASTPHASCKVIGAHQWEICCSPC
jgi:hypothetical protein